MFRLAVIIAAALLSACAQTPSPRAEAGAWGKSAANSATNAATDAAKTKASGAVKDAAASVDPSVLVFATQSVKLDDQALAQVKLLLAQAATAKSIVITGYCNRKEIGNAKAAALARANNTKTELVKLGVSAKKIKVKFVTDESRHAAKIDFPV